MSSSSAAVAAKNFLQVLGFVFGSQALREILQTYWFPKTYKAVADKEKKEEEVLNLPVIEFAAFTNKDKDPEAYKRECKKAAEAFHKYGLLAVRDPRVFSEDNERFLDLMEQYFEVSDGKRDARPELSFQVGVTPEGTEKARDHCSYVAGAYGPDNKPLTPCPPEFDAKWRFFWRIGTTPEKTEFPALNADPVIPLEPQFRDWKLILDNWGSKMLAAVQTLAEMTAEGYDMPKDAFTSRMQHGPHLLAPTGSDYNKYDSVGKILAGFHYDLNFMTIHGKSRFPGLYVWTREGKKCSVRVEAGTLLVQAGKQFELLTGGHVLAGFHEVVINEQTKKVIDARKQQGLSLWRVSSTLFSHIQSDQVLEPLAPFNSEENRAKFQPIKAGHQVKRELDAISLGR